MHSFRSAMQCCQATEKGTANTTELGNLFCSFNYDQISLALLIAGLLSFLLRLVLKVVFIFCTEDVT